MSEYERVGASIEALLAQVPAGELASPALKTRCGLPHIHDPAVVDQSTACDGLYHWAGRAVLGRCPKLVEDEVRARVAGEQKRLAGELAKLSEKFEPRRRGLAGGDRALDTMRRFALAPTFNVLLVGPAGLGKTHLLLRSHFGLLGRGISSQYVRTPELRKLFRRANSYTVEAAEEARALLERFVYAQAVHFDDAGHIEDDQRARGEFAEGLKDLLDRSRGRWAVATNRSSLEAERHPDMTGAVVSRLLLEAETVELNGPDYRAEGAANAKRRPVRAAAERRP